MQIRLGHSPDPDDAFMFWGLAAGAVDTQGFEFEHVLADIQSLNEWALEGRLEVTALSLHAYPFVQDRYILLPHGASMGSGYGPVVVAPRVLTKGELREVEIAVTSSLPSSAHSFSVWISRRTCSNSKPRRSMRFSASAQNMKASSGSGLCPSRINMDAGG